MTWGFSLLGALLLLFPGFCTWLGLRTGSRADYLSPVPDKPNSTFTLFIILVGALLTHTVGALFFAIQEFYCGIGLCFKTHDDPDVYRAILTQDQHLAGSSTGIAFSLVFFLLLGAGAGLIASRLANTQVLRVALRPDGQGWIRAVAEAAADPNRAVTAFVLTKTSNAGLIAAYEGVVQQLTLDDDQAITMIALAGVDRFLVEIADGDMRRLDCETRPMLLMQILKGEIANIAFDIIDLGGLADNDPNQDAEPITRDTPSA